MRAASPYFHWLAAGIATLAYWLPALAMAAPPILPLRHWSGAALIRSGVDSLTGNVGDPTDYRALAGRLTFRNEIFHPDVIPGASAAVLAAPPPPLSVLQASGLFRLAPYLPVELLLVAAALLGVLVTLSLRGYEWTRLFATFGAGCAVIAIGLFAWLGAAAHAQWDRLLTRAPAGVLAPWGGAIGLRLEPGLYLMAACLLVLSVLPSPRGAVA